MGRRRPWKKRKRSVSSEETKERTATHSFKGDTKVDVDKLSSSLVDEDVRDVTVAESRNMASNRVDGDAASVVEAHVEPKRRDLVLLPEEVAKERGERLHDLREDLALLPLALFRVRPEGPLGLGEFLASVLSLSWCHLSAEGGPSGWRVRK